MTPSASATSYPSLAQLPLDRERTTASPYEPRTQRCDLDASSPITRPEVLQIGAFLVWLQRYTQQEHLTVHLRAADNTDFVAVSCPLTGQTTIESLFDLLRSEQERAADTSTAPANVAIDWQGGPISDPSAYDVRLVIAQDAPTTLVYNGALLAAETATRIADNLGRVHRSLAEADLGTPISALTMLSEAEHALVNADGPKRTPGYQPLPIHLQFEACAEQHPDALAVTFEDSTLTYKQLRERARQLAQLLQAERVAPGEAVGVYLTPSVNQLVAMLAIFQIGAVYLPLDPTHPAALVGLMLEQAKPALVLTDSEVAGGIRGVAPRLLDLDQLHDRLTSLTPLASSVAVNLDHPCYLLFTSGTTGKPKGVLARHGNLAHYLHVAQEAYGFGPGDRFCSIARYTFSISMFELLLPLSCGASVQLLKRDDVLNPEQFYKILQHVTALHAGPSLLSALFRFVRNNSAVADTLPGLRHVSSGGDIVPPHVQEEMKEVFPNAELFVIYGCTEVSCMGCTYPIPRDEQVTRSYVGKPFPAVKVRVLDDGLHPLPVGAVGEICFAGPGVVPGYLNRDDLNSERFTNWQGDRWYRTGDMGRFNAHGQLEILGRSDFQVQLRGMRVELGGIENAIRSLGLASQCAVALKTLDDQDMRLVAFVVQPTEERVEPFRRKLAEHLPDYMLPQHVVPLPSLPLTANGKLDRRALNELEWRPKSKADGSSAPRTMTERKIAKAFARALSLDSVGIDDSFFDLGGHSLSAVLLTEQLANELGMTVAPGALFQASTVRELAEYLDGSSNTSHRPIRLSQCATAPSLFLIAGVHLYRNLAKHLEGKYTVYAVYAGAELSLFDAQAKAPPVDALAAQYVEIIRRQQPKGPYRVGGMSFGGIVVYEVAQQLRAQGEQVLFVGMLDAVLPQPGWRGRLDTLQRFRGLERTQQFGLVLDRAKRKLQRFSSPQRTSEFGQFQKQEALNNMEVMREDAYRDASIAYVNRVRDWPAPVTLVAAGRRLAAEPLKGPDCGWRRHVSKLQAHVVEAEHLQLLQEPWVEEVAAIMLRDLEQSESQAVERA